MKLVILNEERTQYHLHKIDFLACECDFNSQRTLVGIDPGSANFGISILHGNNLFLFQVTTEVKSLSNPMDKIMLVHTAGGMCMDYFSCKDYKDGIAVVEGSSYADRYGQAQLGESRATLSLLCFNKNLTVFILPPTRIRKLAFNNGRLKAEEVYKDVLDKKYKDACAALGCLLASTKLDVLNM